MICAARSENWKQRLLLYWFVRSSSTQTWNAIFGLAFDVGCGFSLFISTTFFPRFGICVSAQSIIKPKLSERPFATESSHPPCSRHDYYLYLTSRCKCPSVLWECARWKWLNHNINFRKNFIPFPLSRICPVPVVVRRECCKCYKLSSFCLSLFLFCWFFAFYVPGVPFYASNVCVCRICECMSICVEPATMPIDNTESSNQNTNTHACMQACRLQKKKCLTAQKKREKTQLNLYRWPSIEYMRTAKHE